MDWMGPVSGLKDSGIGNWRCGYIDVRLKVFHPYAYGFDLDS